MILMTAVSTDSLFVNQLQLCPLDGWFVLSGGRLSLSKLSLIIVLATLRTQYDIRSSDLAHGAGPGPR